MLATRSILAYSTVAAAAVLFVACGGGDSATPTPSPSPIFIPPGTPSPAEVVYFKKLTTAMSTISARFDELSDADVPTFDEQLSENALINDVRQYAGRYLDFAADARDFIGPIDAPPSLASLHASLVEAVQDLVLLGTTLALDMELNPALTADDFEDAFFDLNGLVLEQRFRDACSDLQFYADGKDAAIEIVCPR
ncbi:MAG: hypothetical protein IH957_08700 [Chloroflexi bacterium]|nr:hypothetical protein [Chloroflexota bacterium]